jgi:hypothetical protein
LTSATTFEVACACGSGDRHTGNEETRIYVGCWGPEATEFAKATMLGQRVALVIDPTQGQYDRYGRTYLQ